MQLVLRVNGPNNLKLRLVHVLYSLTCLIVNFQVNVVKLERATFGCIVPYLLTTFPTFYNCTRTKQKHSNIECHNEPIRNVMSSGMDYELIRTTTNDEINNFFFQNHAIACVLPRMLMIDCQIVMSVCINSFTFTKPLARMKLLFFWFYYYCMVALPIYVIAKLALFDC